MSLRLPPVGQAAEWIRKAAGVINQLIGRVETLEGYTAPSYTVATLPADSAGKIALVTDESGGAVLAFNDGSDWRRVTDRAVVS